MGGTDLDWIRRHFSRDWGFYAIESQDLSGGIMVAWDPGAARIDVFHRYPQHVAPVVSEAMGPT